jgi:hypothetical protein
MTSILFWFTLNINLKLGISKLAKYKKWALIDNRNPIVKYLKKIETVFFMHGSKLLKVFTYSAK